MEGPSQGRQTQTPKGTNDVPAVEEYDLLIGQTLAERYLVEARIGDGGMGVVFRAKHVVIDKIVAVKVLRRDVARNDDVVSRFIREAKSASTIGHPNIVDVTDFGVTDTGLTFQVMEFIDGPTLNQVLWDAEPSRIGAVFVQIARALAVAHEKGIVHRDLKPDNIFLLQRSGFRDFVKICDFGIAKVIPTDGTAVRNLTKAGAIFGTPEYMSPEQAMGRTDIDQRADIYALGVMLYERLTGRLPHQGATAADTVVMQVQDPILPPKTAAPDRDIPDALESVVMIALAKDRRARFDNMTAFANALESALSQEPAPTQPHRRGKMLLLAAACLAAGTAVALFSSRGGHDEIVSPVRNEPQGGHEPRGGHDEIVSPVRNEPATLRPAPPSVIEPTPTPTPTPTTLTIRASAPGAAIFVNGDLSGHGRTTVRQSGALRIVCKKKGYTAGRVRVSLKKGEKRSVTCEMTKCIPGLKNPFGQCE